MQIRAPIIALFTLQEVPVKPISLRLPLLLALLVLVSGCMTAIRDQRAKDREASWSAMHEQSTINGVQSGSLRIPENLARRYAIGTFSGAICQGRQPIELKVSDIQQVGPGTFRVIGTFQSLSLPPEPLGGVFQDGSFKLWFGPSESQVTGEILVAKDLPGVGWDGAFSSQSASDCSDISFVHSGGVNTEKLPRPNPAFLGIDRAKPSEYNTKQVPANVMNWAKKLSDHNDTEATYVLARGTEQAGKPALQLYILSAEKYGDTRAQLALSRLEESPGDREKWATRAAAQIASARKICGSRHVADRALELIEAESKDPVIGIATLMALTTGVLYVPGKTRVNSVKLSEFVSFRQRFYCEATAITGGERVVNFAPDIEYLGTDDMGDPVYLDRRVHNTIVELAADAASRRPPQVFSRRIQVEYMHGDKYRMSIAGRGWIEFEMHEDHESKIAAPLPMVSPQSRR